jgi:tripartite-type tricarboxylate transporter receptor subunit TctC
MAVLDRRALLLGSLCAPALARAQTSDWPKGAIRVVVPFPPGGTTDPVARILAAKVADNTGWNMVIENKPGAAGAIGAAIACQGSARRPDLDGDLRQPHLSPAFTPNLAYKDSDC